MKKILLVTIGLSIALCASVTRDNDKEVVVDSATHLMWQDNEDAKTVEKSWIEAIEYCENLTLAGFDDWRLPNIRELKSITDLNKVGPAIVDGFTNTSSSRYWSSSTTKSEANLAWGVYFYDGYDHWYFKDDNYYVRCVHDND